MFTCDYWTKNDLEEIVKMESSSIDFHWKLGDFQTALEEANKHVLVARDQHKFVGYVFFEVNASSVEILRMAVAEKYRRQGIGTELLEAIKQKSWSNTELIAYLREDNLVGQLFFKKNNLVATIEREFFGDEIIDDQNDSPEPVPFIFEDALRFAIKV